MNKLYSLLNKECEKINCEKKQKIIDRSNKKGFNIDSSDVNLLQMQEMLEDDSSSQDDNNFEIKLQNVDQHTLRNIKPLEIEVPEGILETKEENLESPAIHTPTESLEA